MQSSVDIRKGTYLLVLSIGISTADQLIKRMINRFPENTIIYELKPLVQIIRTQNSGAAFSLMNQHSVMLLTVTTIMLLGLLGVILFCKSITPGARIALSVLLGGGLGNWVDRFIGGTVTDYIRLLFIQFPVFNAADIFITVSVIWLIGLLATDRFEIRTGE